MINRNGHKQLMTDVEIELDDNKKIHEEAIAIKRDWVVVYQNQRITKYIPKNRVMVIRELNGGDPSA